MNGYWQDFKVGEVVVRTISVLVMYFIADWNRIAEVLLHYDPMEESLPHLNIATVVHPSATVARRLFPGIALCSAFNRAESWIPPNMFVNKGSAALLADEGLSNKGVGFLALKRAKPSRVPATRNNLERGATVYAGDFAENSMSVVLALLRAELCGRDTAREARERLATLLTDKLYFGRLAGHRNLLTGFGVALVACNHGGGICVSRSISHCASGLGSTVIAKQ